MIQDSYEPYLREKTCQSLKYNITLDLSRRVSDRESYAITLALSQRTSQFL